MTKVFVQGMGEVDLAQKDFIAKGGEGSIYGKGDIAYKIYEDPTKMIPVAKIQELSALNRPCIIKPELLLLDKKNKPIGYTMKLVKDTYALCQLFNRTFKQRNNLSPEDMIKLVQSLQEIIAFIHSKHILVVDLNELNFLADQDCKELYAIDVNSYQTKNFPATAIMESVRDRHCNNKFNQETDWFSWGILAFQMMIGIHPYKGKHPKYDHLPVIDRMDARMKDNVSVFHPDASTPNVCEPFDVIPNALKQWFVAIFENGKRVPPPMDYEAILQIIAKVKEITGSDLFEISELGSYLEDIISFHESSGVRVVVTKNHVYVNTKQYDVSYPAAKIGFTPRMNKPILAFIENKRTIRLFDVINNRQIPITVNGDAIVESNNRLYIQSGTNMLEVNFIEAGANILASVKPVGNVLDVPGATRAFDTVIAQNMLGRYVFSIFPSNGRSHQLNIKELDGYKLVDAKFQNNVLVVVGVKTTGEYDRLVFRPATDYGSYDCRKTENVTYTGLNFSVADHGICTLMNEDEKVELFSNKKDSASVKILDDKAVKGDIRFFHEGSGILFAKGKKLYRIKMK